MMAFWADPKGTWNQGRWKNRIQHMDDTEPIQPFELQSMRHFSGGGACDGKHKEIELLDDEPEGNHGDAGAHPGKKRPLIGRMVGIATNHGAPRSS
jgi:hypothetical protein